MCQLWRTKLIRIREPWGRELWGHFPADARHAGSGATTIRSDGRWRCWIRLFLWAQKFNPSTTTAYWSRAGWNVCQPPSIHRAIRWQVCNGLEISHFGVFRYFWARARFGFLVKSFTIWSNLVWGMAIFTPFKWTMKLWAFLKGEKSFCALFFASWGLFSTPVITHIF